MNWQDNSLLVQTWFFIWIPWTPIMFNQGEFAATSKTFHFSSNVNLFVKYSQTSCFEWCEERDNFWNCHLRKWRFWNGGEMSRNMRVVSSCIYILSFNLFMWIRKSITSTCGSCMIMNLWLKPKMKYQEWRHLLFMQTYRIGYRVLLSATAQFL